jgi:nucleoside-diphosphate-sugar epimerase
MSAEHRAAFEDPRVQFRQANLSAPASIKKHFDPEGGPTWDVVFNLAAETKFGQTDEVYKENVIDIATQCSNAAAKAGVKRFIHMSTAQVYDAGKKASKEDDKTKPWTKLAKAHLAAEEVVRKVSGLQVVIVRPAVIYGPGDVLGIMPRVICAAVYQYMNEKMEFLWDKDLRLNTVHVRDVVAALWHLTTNGSAGEIYNLADSGETDQGTINKHLESMFKIKTSFMGFLASKAATAVAMKTVAETANENHLKPWSDLCKAKGITSTPLTPYLDEELLYNNALSVDGSKITKTGFSYKYPEPTEALLREAIQYNIDLNTFPKGLI